MKNPFVFLLLIAILHGCASSKNEKSDIIDAKGEWIYEPQKGCTSNQLCASGEGHNQEEADLNAKKSLAGVFETKIKAQFQYTKTSLGHEEKVQMEESIVDEVNAQVDQIIKGVVIVKRFQKNELIFSLAALNKTNSAQVFRQEITRIDDELKHFFSLSSRIYIKKLLYLYNAREIFNEKLMLITGHGIPRSIQFSEIKNLKYEDQKSGRVIFTMSEDVPQTLVIKTQTALTDIGFKVVTGENRDFEIVGDFSSTKEYLNVDGFQKYTFEYFLETKNAVGKKIGGMSLTYTANGRNEKNAFLKIRKQLLTDIDANLEKLNLDEK